MTAMLAVCLVSDLRSRTVPNRAVALGALAALAIVLASDPAALGGRVIAAAAAGGFLLAPALLKPGSMGMGDVKLGAVLGLYLGAAVVLTLLVAFLAGSLTGALLAIRHGRAARKMAIPFVPCLALGAAVSAV
jgi:leader peptidase (prepilin peptidase)/N-methyltransferase